MFFPSTKYLLTSIPRTAMLPFFTPKLANMKKYLSFLPVLLLVSFIAIPKELSRKEKKFAIGYLEETRDYLFNTVSGLTEDQFNFKPASDRWSIRECIQHIALSEVNLRQMVDASLN